MQSLSFKAMLMELERRYDEEVGQLREEIALLRSAATPPSWPGVRSQQGGAEQKAAESQKDNPEDNLEDNLEDNEAQCIGGGAHPTVSAQNTVALGTAEKAVGAPDQDLQGILKPMGEAQAEPAGAAAKPTSSTGSSAAGPKRSYGHHSSSAHLRAYVKQRTQENLSLREWRAWGRHAVLSRWFEILIGVAIVVNILVIFAQLELRGRSAGVSVGANLPEDGRAGYISILDTAISAFTMFFAVEMSLKAFFLRLDLVIIDGEIQWFNIFDLAVVVVSCVDAWVMPAVEAEVVSNNISLMRAFRIVRVLRVLRVARTLHIFSSLRVLCSAVFASFFALFWAMVLLSVVMLMSGLFLCESLVETIKDPNLDDEIRQWAYMYYGTSSRACWSVFQLTFSGGWPNYARPLVEKVSVGYVLFFFVYVTSVTFAMFRIITAMFLKDTLRVAAMDVDNTIDEKLAEKAHYRKKLAEFFDAADSSGDGLLTLEEFDYIMSDDRVKAYFSSLDLNPAKTRSLFLSADSDRSGVISVDEFLSTAMSMKGMARQQDIALMDADVRSLGGKLEELQSMVRFVHDQVALGAMSI